MHTDRHTNICTQTHQHTTHAHTHTPHTPHTHKHTTPHIHFCPHCIHGPTILTCKVAGGIRITQKTTCVCVCVSLSFSLYLTHTHTHTLLPIHKPLQWVPHMQSVAGGRTIAQRTASVSPLGTAHHTCNHNVFCLPSSCGWKDKNRTGYLKRTNSSFLPLTALARSKLCSGDL